MGVLVGVGVLVIVGVYVFVGVEVAVSVLVGGKLGSRVFVGVGVEVEVGVGVGDPTLPGLPKQDVRRGGLLAFCRGTFSQELYQLVAEITYLEIRLSAPERLKSLE